MAKKKSTGGEDASGANAAAATGSAPRPLAAPVAAPAATPARSPLPVQPYVVLARKYRPQTFDDLIGQSAMVQTLTNAFASGRIAQGYMLTGVRGIGKTTTARILARALNYEREATAQHPAADRPTIDIRIPGRHCAEIMESRHPDVIEMDAASNTGIDNIREIIESARYRPILARHKVFIIDEVHMLSKGAFNALLKTLEEPPDHVKFVFATTEIRKVPVTVLSRCQRFDLRRVDVPELMQHFRNIIGTEGALADDDALALIARAAEGSVRDGLSILDQAIASSATQGSDTHAERASGTHAERASGTHAERASGTHAERASGTHAERASGTHAERASGTHAERASGTHAERASGTHAERASGTHAERASGTTGRSHVTAAAVRSMLGLADRGRILDLLTHLMRGDAKASLDALASLHKDGAEPIQALTDLADAVHVVSRIKATGADGAADVLSAEERRRVGGFAAQLSMPLLARAWQMLLKAIEEAGRAPDQFAAAEMALIRIAYMADLPSPDEVIRALGGASLPAGRGRAVPPQPGAGTQGLVNQGPAIDQAASSATGENPDLAATAERDVGGARLAVDAGLDSIDADLDLERDLGFDDPAESGASAPALAPPIRSFADVVDLAGGRRDAKLKVHLDEHVSLVKFDANAGAIDLFLLPGAPPELANDLREKLNAWTQRRWIVMLSKVRGEPPLGEVKRQRAAAEIEDLKRHPAVAAVLQEFPDARISAVRDLAIAPEEDTGTG